MLICLIFIDNARLKTAKEVVYSVVTTLLITLFAENFDLKLNNFCGTTVTQLRIFYSEGRMENNVITT